MDVTPKSMQRLIPILGAISHYNQKTFKADLGAGLTVAVMLIPQGMAYALIAGLPPVYGLYAAIFPQIVYALFGTSRQLAVGPVAMDSLLVATGVSALAVAGTDHYISLAILLALMMGAIQLLMGVLRLGFVANFLSKPVISGFTFAAALIIGFNQLKHLLGIDLARSKYLHEIFMEAGGRIMETNWITLLIGVSGIGLISILKKVKIKIPASLVVVVLGILLVWLLGLDQSGVKIVGVIPMGLPSFSINHWDFTALQSLLPIASTLAIIAFVEAYSVAKAIETKHRGEYEVSANKELVALGLGNVIGSFFQCYPTTGGFSRSAVNESAGAKTTVTSLISALIIVLTLLFLTPLFYYLPKAILASVIMVAVFGLIDVKEIKFLWSSDKYDFSLMVAVFLGTLLLGIESGIGIGVVLSLVVLIYKTSTPHMAVLGKVEGTNHFRNLKRYPAAIDREDLSILRFDDRIYYANANALKNKVDALVATKRDTITAFILDAQSISDVDSSGLSMLSNQIDALNEAGIKLKMVSVIGPVRDKLLISGLVSKIGLDNFHASIQEAVAHLDKQPVEKSVAFQTNV